jgi:NTE family protein
MESMDCKADTQVMEWKTHSRHARPPRQSMEERWGAGYYDTVHTLRHSEVLQRPQNFEGVLTFDLGQNGRE